MPTPTFWRKHAKQLTTPKAGDSCEYCERPERYNLDPALQERTEEHSGLDKVIRFVSWHYETITYCRDVPRVRVRCQKNLS
jgi:hypothetical protein